MSIDEEISLWGNRMVLSGVIYREGEQSHCGHYASGVNMDNTWFLISDTRILRQQKPQCSSRDISVLYILIYKKKSNFLIAPSNSLNGTAGVISTAELISETAETVNMIRHSVLQELEKQKAKLAVDQEKEKTNSNKVKSPVKRKSKFTNRSFRENDKMRKNFMPDNLEEGKKEYSRKMDNKRKKAKRDDLDDNHIKQLRIYEKR